MCKFVILDVKHYILDVQTIFWMLKFVIGMLKFVDRMNIFSMIIILYKYCSCSVVTFLFLMVLNHLWWKLIKLIVLNNALVTEKICQECSFVTEKFRLELSVFDRNFLLGKFNLWRKLTNTFDGHLVSNMGHTHEGCKATLTI